MMQEKKSALGSSGFSVTDIDEVACTVTCSGRGGSKDNPSVIPMSSRGFCFPSVRLLVRTSTCRAQGETPVV
eukprot:CAMPEP_0173398796 /NCGR_PEP_ID=MMETSP1356-20130122/42980_1 /TAXON_ID=77927 ORGANISM="Hemiselmis virescens, Strain PCC157" /NCGR_SAMPLE_ID=MMETSP1356 /ASSEMBLY_ACC=CAM_ASM_000847 /LENGTH=71 /DNA_ID=CAMNT_0014358377 /DNA_START=295 /DNA_END=506 /DNA_ORIENTATION=+